MKNSNEIKHMVRDRYAAIALQDKNLNASSCCGATACCDDTTTLMADDYSKVKGYNPDADLGLGCGVPTLFAKIRKGDTVIDLGSGAGNDAFVARNEAGEDGLVIGIDMTEAMIEKARANTARLNYTNVEFRLGDIEKMPVTANFADVVISNCVLNLVPDKEKAFGEISRVLKPGGHFSISDVVLNGTLPAKLRAAAEMYAGCISGALERKDYLEIIDRYGFKNVSIRSEKNIVIPDAILATYLSEGEIIQYRESGSSIQSITVYGEKEGCCNTEAKKCC